MRKIGIITIPDYNNYGNRLQNYAVKNFFEKKGYYVETLEMNDPDFKKYKARKQKLQLKKRKMLNVIFLFEMLKGGIDKAKRERKFEEFTLKYLNVEYIPEYNDKIINYVNEKFDFFVLGSDQIWHPYVNDTPNLYFANFTTSNKKIFFAPSFGMENIPDDYKRIVVKGLQNTQHLNVREKAGAKIIREILNKKAEVFLDPTLITSKTEWDKIAIKPDGLKDNDYILSYFLGPQNEEYKKVIASIKEKVNGEIFEIANKKEKNGYVTGPSEFVYSIKKAKFIVTDSFHAVAFAIIFHKPFIVFSRLNNKGKNAGLDSRIDGLLEKMQLVEKKYSNEESICFDKFNFDVADSVIKQEKKKIENFYNYMDVI